MGKSQETFSKKEKEKKKLKKRLEKKEKKEERKANAANGNNIDEMLAYVDENGNISNTPPDPGKKKEIKKESIQIGVPAGEASEDERVRKGVVTFFNEAKGYGFIKDKISQQSIFVHQNEIKESIKENNLVTFEIIKTPKGPNAIKVKKLIR